MWTVLEASSTKFPDNYSLSSQSKRAWTAWMSNRSCKAVRQSPYATTVPPNEIEYEQKSICEYVR